MRVRARHLRPAFQGTETIFFKPSRQSRQAQHQIPIHPVFYARPTYYSSPESPESPSLNYDKWANLNNDSDDEDAALLTTTRPKFESSVWHRMLL